MPARAGNRQILTGVTLDADRGELVAHHGTVGLRQDDDSPRHRRARPFQAGRVSVDDVALEGGAVVSSAMLARLRRKVGMVFQFHCLFEHLSALQNVWLAPVHAHGVELDDAERRARELLTAFGVEHRAEALAARAVGRRGAARRDCARAGGGSAVLLMDEPTASLDAARRAELGELLKGLVRQGRTLVIATHDEDFARGCATRVLRVSDGAVFATPGPESL